MEPEDNNTETHIALTKGMMVSHYRIIEKIGAGGMGEVYLAEDTELGRKVALKFLASHLCPDEDCRKRFKREAQAVAKLDHSNIVTVHEVGEFQKRPYFVMQHVEGQSLRDVIKQGKLGMSEVVDLTMQICEGLQEAHEAGVIHRDVKPSNIIIDGKGRPRLLDFGLAMMASEDKLTKTGSTLGTVGYMSPEQVGGKTVDQRSDLFSVGVILYEMLTCHQPFEGDNDAAILRAITDSTPEPVARFKSGVSTDLQQVIDKALTKDVTLRYQHADGMLADLKRLKLESAPEKKSRIGLWLAGAIIVVVAAVALIVTKPWISKPTDSQPEKIMLAVLPFENLGAPEDEYFAEGMSEEITARLGGVHNLGVIARTSTKQYKNTAKPIRQIGEELGVDYILEGTVRWQKSVDGPGQVRITPQLIKVADETHIWADVYDEVLTEVFGVQSDIAQRVVDALHIALLEPEREALASRPTENLEAYDYYLRGDEYVSDYSETGLRNAESLFLKAVELEQDFALAHAMLSYVHTQMYAFYYDHTAERLAAAKEAVDHAFEIEPDLPDAHGALGFYYFRGDIDNNKALEQFTILREKRPSDGLAQFFLAVLQRRLGKWDDCIENFEEAYKLDPRWAAICLEYGVTLLYLRRYAEAETLFDRTIDIRPGRYPAYVSLSWLHVLRNGDTKEARRVLQRALQATGRLPELTYTALELDLMDGNYDQALSCLTGPGEIGRLSSVTDSAAYYNFKADIYRYLNQEHSMEAYYDSARIIMERLVMVSPDDPWHRASLASAYAGIDRKQDAVREAKLAVELLPLSENAISGTEMLKYLAITYITIAEYDLAIEQLDHLLSIPSEMSPAYLAIWPDYAPLRDHPRFQALLEKYGEQDGA